MSRERGGHGMILSGSIVLGVGMIFLLRNLGIIPQIDVMWPLFPIIVGLALIVGGLRAGRATKQDPPRD